MKEIVDKGSVGRSASAWRSAEKVVMLRFHEIILDHIVIEIGQRVFCMHPMRMQRIWATDLRNWNVSGTHRADRANRKIE